MEIVDKAKVEVGVQIVERWILAALRHRTFFSLAELNHAIAERLEWLNARPFRKLPGSRLCAFESIDRPALRVSVLTVSDGHAVGLFDGIWSLTGAMPGRVSR